jgi:Uncharacterised nucleotidyltransferase
MRQRPLPADVSPHNEILLLCARTRVDSSAENRIRTLIANEQDFAGIIAAAADHCIAPLICHHLVSAASQELPPVWHEQLREEFFLNSRRNLFLAGSMFQILDAFKQSGILVVPHKGPSLAALAYGDIALRQFADLDFLLLQPQIPSAHEILLGLGYHPEIQWKSGPDSHRIPGHYAYTKPLGGMGRGRRPGGQSTRDSEGTVTIELHTPATMRYFPRPLPLDELLPRPEKIEIAGQCVEVLAREDALPLLCVHGGKHLWDQLSYIADVSELVQAPADFDWERALSLSGRLGADRMTLLGLAVARRFLDTPLPQEVVDRISQDTSISQLVDEIAMRLFQEKRVRPNAVRRFWARVRMGGGAWGGLRYGLRILAMPTEEDWAQRSLPRGLEPLYGVLRSLRFLRERGATSAGIPKDRTVNSQGTLSEPVMIRMMELAHISPDDFVLDMTWEQGRAVVRAAQEYGARGFAFARTARDVAEAKAYARAAGVYSLVRFFECEPDESHFAKATVILLGRGESSNLTLSNTVLEKLLPGTRIVSCAAAATGWPSVKLEHVEDSEGNSVPVYLWKRQ